MTAGIRCSSRIGCLRRLRRVLARAVACVALGSAAQQPQFNFTDRDDGISCTYFDVGLLIAWPKGRPLWTDAGGQPDGPRALAVDRASGDDTRRVRRIDVTRSVQSLWAGGAKPYALMLRNEEGSIVSFHSREAADPASRPQLLLQAADGRKRYLEPAADATLDCSTYRGLGRAPVLSVRRENWIALRFDIEAARKLLGSAPTHAELVLVRTPDDKSGSFRLSAFMLRPPYDDSQEQRAGGIAARYPDDRGIATDPEVFFADGFESRTLDARWNRGMRAPFEFVDEDRKRGFAPLSGRALRVTIPRGELLGLDLRYRFRDHHGAEPTEVYFRYYLRLAPSWLLATQGGKLPGLAGTYGKAGWGGRKWDGAQGWSARGSYGATPPEGHPARGQTLLGTYAYHSGSSGYGEGFGWTGAGLAGLVQPDRWYCIEQRLKINTPGREDGVLQVWIDGRMALSREGLRLRDVDALRIEEVWMNFYHGGTEPAPVEMHAYIDSVVVARSYVGMLSR